MGTILAALVCGLVFGIGLVISGMTQPTKVLGFLDIFGTWDPTLAFVMGGALLAAAPGFYFARKRTQPLLAAQFRWPTRNEIDGTLIGGSVLFGAGWGLIGLCPGPAIVNLATLLPQVAVFVIAMGIGTLSLTLWRRIAGGPPTMAGAG
jgi:uncharacterized membrane protein YedE/YeeE